MRVNFSAPSGKWPQKITALVHRLRIRLAVAFAAAVEAKPATAVEAKPATAAEAKSATAAEANGARVAEAKPAPAEDFLPAGTVRANAVSVGNAR